MCLLIVLLLITMLISSCLVCQSLFLLMFSLFPTFCLLGTAATTLPMPGGFAPVSLSSGVARSRLATIKIRICKAIACQPTVLCHLADELDCMGLIPATLQQAVKYADGRGPYEKADAMIDPVIECVRSDPRKFAPALMKALNEVGLGLMTTESDLIAAAQ